MTRRTASLGQMPLFTLGPVPVHIRRWSAEAGAWTCAWCRGDLLAAARWDQIGGCHKCPGFVEPAPPWALLATVDQPGTAGAELGEAA